MVKHTAKSITRVLKSKFKKLFDVRVHLIKSRRAESITPKSSKSSGVIPAEPRGAIFEQDEHQQPEGIEPNLLVLEGLPSVQESNAGGYSADPKLASGNSAPNMTGQEQTPVNHKHLSHAEVVESVAEKSSLRHLEYPRADSGAVFSSSATAGAVREASDADGMPATTHGPRSPKACIAIPQESDISQQLQMAILEHRNLKVLEQDADVQLSTLEDQAGTIARQIDGLQDVINHLNTGQVDTEQSAEIDALYDAITDLRTAEDDNWQRQQRLKRHMSELYQEFRNEQCTMFDNLDVVLVEKGLIPRALPFASTAGQHPGDSSQVSHGPGSTTRPMDASNQATKDEKAHLLHDCLKKRKKLGACELRFDSKDNLLDALEESRTKQLAAGEEVETSTEFDLFMYEETRQMTRALIDAEADYTVSKAVAVAAGIQLKFSDLESGFVDDVNDGYRVSMKRDMVQDCDRKRIEEWLADMEEKECPTRYLSIRDFAGMDIMGEEGEASLREVDISDSRSMVADGPSRKRIDRWTAQLYNAV